MHLHRKSNVSIFRKCRPFLIFMLSFVLLLSIGCAGQGGWKQYESKFGKSVHADIGFFADHTIALVNDANLGMSKDEAIYTRQYFRSGEAEETRFNNLVKEADALLDGIIQYSIELVTIAETQKTEEGRVNAYADYLDRLDDWVEKELDLGDTHYKDLVTSVREQESFQDALIQAQPLINAVSRYGGLTMNEIMEAADDLAIKMDAKIDFDFLEVIEYNEALQDEKHRILDAFEQLYLTYSGDEEAFDKIRTTGTVRAKGLIPKGQPTNEDLIKIAEHLRTRMKALRVVEKEMMDDWELYWKTHEELDRLYSEVTTNCNRARLVFLVWPRAHQKMSSGKVAPAEWFDISELPKDLFNLGTRLVF